MSERDSADCFSHHPQPLFRKREGGEPNVIGAGEGGPGDGTAGKPERPQTQRRRPRHMLPAGILVCACILQIPLRQRLDRVEEKASEAAVLRQPEALLFSHSGHTLRTLSLGFNGLLANLYWTRAIQFYGRERMSKHPHYEGLATLLRLTTDLDPHLLIAYRFGAIFLAAPRPDGPGEPFQAMQLLRRGIVANPGYWRLWEDWGFVEYWDLHNYARAARIFEAGSRRPGAEIWMKTLAATVAAKGGETRTSQFLWTQVYKTAQNKTIRKSALDHLAALKAWQDIQKLNHLLALYQIEHGHPAGSLQDLVEAGLLPALPVDPSGAPYQLAVNGQAKLGRDSAVNLSLAR